METKTEIVICMGSSCFARGNRTNVEIVQKYLKEHDLEERIVFKGRLCTENCNKGPMLQIGEKQYFEVSTSLLYSILADHFEK